MIHREMQVPRPTLAIPEWETWAARTPALQMPLAATVNGTHLVPEAVARVAQIKAVRCRIVVDSAELPMDRTGWAA
jgi:hypothetical protein